MREKMVNPFLHGKWGFGLLLCAFFFLIGGAVPALAGWVQTPEYRYIGEDGSYLRDEWVEENGNRFYLDEDGKLVTGFYTFEDGTECFFGPGGYLQTGLFQVDGRTYLADGDGVLLYGEQIVNGEACVFTEDGPAVRIFSDPVSPADFGLAGEGASVCRRSHGERADVPALPDVRP